MRILIVNKYWYLRGGSERVALVTKKLLEEAGHKVELFGMNHPKNIFSNKYFIDNIDYKNLGFIGKIKAGIKSVYNSDARAKFELILGDFKPDIVHFHNIYHQLSFSLLKGLKKRGIRSVMTLHDYKMISPNYNLFHHGKICEKSVGKHFFLCMLLNCMESWGQSFFAAIEAYYRKFANLNSKVDMYISPSNFLKNKFIENGWDGSEINIIPNPLELNRFVYSDNDGSGVLYIGRLAQEKGVFDLLKTVELTPSISYSIVGTGPAEEKMKKIASDKGLTNIKFYGWQTGSKLLQYIKEAKIIVVPSVWYENYPMNVLEAKAMGKIVLASRIGGLSEMLPEKMLFEPSNIEDMVEKIKFWNSLDSNQRIGIGKILRKNIETSNSSETYLKSLLDLYNA